MNPIVTTAPARYPVSLAEVRAQLAVDTEDNDPRYAAYIAAATALVENYIGRSLIQRTYRAFLNWWPMDFETGAVRPYIQLERPPLISVTALTTYDDSDNATVFSPTYYFVDTARTFGRIVLRRGVVWPAFPTAMRVANGIQIDWVAGYGPNPGDVPEPIRLAILVVVGMFNEQRGDESAPQSMPFAAQALLDPYVLLSPSN
jgi:uncharacterized phiE125 gp8 family phage protein